MTRMARFMTRDARFMTRYAVRDIANGIFMTFGAFNVMILRLDGTFPPHFAW